MGELEGGMSAQRSPLQRGMQRGGETVFNALIQRGSVGARRTGEARTHGQTTPPPPTVRMAQQRQTQPQTRGCCSPRALLGAMSDAHPRQSFAYDVAAIYYTRQ